jgi:predicted CXXCH cytochrome family protein
VDVNEGEDGTSYISAASRTLPTMKSLNAGSAPVSFGCTYCHSDDLNAKMKGVLTHFGGQMSKHSVGKVRGGAETQNEYLTTWDTTFLTELDCIDCHDPLLVVDQNPANLALDAPYANHVSPADASRTTNPYMLRNEVMTDLCRGCHGAVPAAWWTLRGKANPPALVDHAETALQESDTTPLVTSDCADCHDSHYSTNSKLFNDGHEGDTAISMGDAAQCDVCHFRGDANGNYDTHGHGQALSAGGTPMDFSCGSCHNVNSQHDGTNAKMLNFVEDPVLSTFGKSLTSVCYICHSGYEAHTGGGSNVGCVDCHDEHAENSGAASNILMIPLDVPNNHGTPDSVFFEDDGSVAGNFDYYRAAGNGICDNQTCHTGVTTATAFPIWPLSGLMTGSEHSGDDQSPNIACNGCHTHDDTISSWGASASCDNCHAMPPPTLAHIKHVTVYGMVCDRCHQNAGNHNESAIVDDVQYNSTPIATIRNLQSRGELFPGEGGPHRQRRRDLQQPVLPRRHGGGAGRHGLDAGVEQRRHCSVRHLSQLD